MGQNELLEMSLTARGVSVPRVRAAVTAFARAAGMATERIENLRLAVSEAVTNVVLHAYEDEEGFVRVTAAVAESDLWVLVEDDGLGLRSGRISPGLGIGLPLIECFSDELAVERGADGGTLLRMRFGLTSGPPSSESAPLPRRSRGIPGALDAGDAGYAQARG